MTEQSARVGISTISFRHRPLAEALRLIADTGACEIDLGAIPAVTDHVPVPFHGRSAEYVSAIRAEGLRTGAVNADPGDLNDPVLTAEALTAGIVHWSLLYHGDLMSIGSTVPSMNGLYILKT